MTTQRQLGFGAAASMVHPATGKQYLESIGPYIFLSYGVLCVLIKCLQNVKNCDAIFADRHVGAI